MAILNDNLQKQTDEFFKKHPNGAQIFVFTKYLNDNGMGYVRHVMDFNKEKESVFQDISYDIDDMKNVVKKDQYIKAPKK